MHRMLLLLSSIPCIFAANQPTFIYTVPSSAIVSAVAVDSQGNTYLAGQTNTANIPVTPGAFQTQFGGSSGQIPVFCFAGPFIPLMACNDAFVIKLDPTGQIVFATYLGGNGDEGAYGIAVDASGNVYVAGSTKQNAEGANTFPVTPGAAFMQPDQYVEGFIAKLNPSGSQLLYATLMPGAALDALAIDPAGNAYVTGYSGGVTPYTFPATSGAFQTAPKNTMSISAGVVAKLNPSGSALVYATYLSGSGEPNQGDVPLGITVDSSSEAAITGYTGSADFPVTSGAFRTASPSQVSAFVTKLNPQGTGLVFSTYLGASKASTMNVKYDPQGGLYVAGPATAANFPTTPGAFQSTPAGGFLAHISPDGSSLLYSTYLPLFPPDIAMDLDSSGNIVVGGTTSTSGEPTGVGAFQTDLSGTNPSYIMKFNPAGQLLGATYLSAELGLLAAAPDGSVIAVGPYSISPASVTSLFPALTVQNAASLAANDIAPGEIGVIRGYGIGPATGTAQPTGLQVFFDNYAAPVLYAQSQQLNVQVPWEIAGRASTQLRIEYPGVSSASIAVSVATAAPGVFYVNNSDGTKNSLTNPAVRGDFISIYGTGGGLTDPAGATGSFWPATEPFPVFTLPVSVTIAGQNATLIYAGSSPLNLSGIFQINVRLPLDLSATSAPLVVTVGTASSPSVRVAVQ